MARTRRPTSSWTRSRISWAALLVKVMARISPARARSVQIDVDAAGSIEPGPEPALDPECHYLDGPAEDVAAYVLTLEAINFGSGWFPTLRKRAGSSGYVTIAGALADRFRAAGPW